jgi:hypothetical protein
VDEKISYKLLEEFHEGVYGGHFAPTTTAHRIMRVDYYRSEIFKDSYAMIRNAFLVRNFQEE